MVIALLFSLVAVSACRADSVMPGEVVVSAADGLQVHAYLDISPDKTGSAPLLVMLPMRGRTHTSYDNFAAAIGQRFDEAGGPAGPRPHRLTFDLRGHGASIIRGEDTLLFESMPDSEYRKIPSDVAIVIDSVVTALGSRVDARKIFVVGASIGANAAVMTSAYLPNLAKVVMLSPGLDYHGLTPSDAFENFAGETLIVATRGDSYSYDSVQQIMKRKMKNWLLKAYPGDQHGTNLLDKDERAMQDVVVWLFP
jgi:pimeloyl-ACP methyl ester carboxylesterase